MDGGANCRFLLQRDTPGNEMASQREVRGESVKKREEGLGLKVGEDQVKARSGRQHLNAPMNDLNPVRPRVQGKVLPGSTARKRIRVYGDNASCIESGRRNGEDAGSRSDVQD